MVKTRSAGDSVTGDPVMCHGFFFLKGNPFLFVSDKPVFDLPHEESLSQIPAVPYAHGNH
jgi:hypothetical protein